MECFKDISGYSDSHKKKSEIFLNNSRKVQQVFAGVVNQIIISPQYKTSGLWVKTFNSVSKTVHYLVRNASIYNINKNLHRIKFNA